MFCEIALVFKAQSLVTFVFEWTFRFGWRNWRMLVPKIPPYAAFDQTIAGRTFDVPLTSHCYYGSGVCIHWTRHGVHSFASRGRFELECWNNSRVVDGTWSRYSCSFCRGFVSPLWGCSALRQLPKCQGNLAKLRHTSRPCSILMKDVMLRREISRGTTRSNSNLSTFSIEMPPMIFSNSITCTVSLFQFKSTTRHYVDINH